MSRFKNIPKYSLSTICCKMLGMIVDKITVDVGSAFYLKLIGTKINQK